MFCATRQSNLILLIPGIGCYSKTRRIALKVAVVYYNTINLLQEKKKKSSILFSKLIYFVPICKPNCKQPLVIPYSTFCTKSSFNNRFIDSKENYKIRRLPLQFYNLFMFIINMLVNPLQKDKQFFHIKDTCLCSLIWNS